MIYDIKKIGLAEEAICSGFGHFFRSFTGLTVKKHHMRGALVVLFRYWSDLFVREVQKRSDRIDSLGRAG